MADVVGALANSLELSSKVIHYLNDLKHGGQDRDKIKREVEAAGQIIVTLYQLQRGVRQSNDCPKQLRAIMSPGPDGSKSLLSGYEDLLQEIMRKLEPKDHHNSTMGRRANAVAYKVTWPFKKEDVQDMVKDLKSMESSFQSVLHSVQIGMMNNVINSIDQIQLAQDEIDFRDHCSWLSDVSPSLQLKSLVDVSESSRPTWIFKDPIFQEWRTDSSSRVLWAKGNPGAGKSVLAAVVASHLRAEATSISTKSSVAVFFYRYNDSVTVETMLGCIARQLLEQGGAELLPKVKEARETTRHDPGRYETITLLQELWSHFDENFLIIDALDECDANMQSTTVSHLRLLLEGIPSLRILITSRGDMEMYFSESEYFCHAKRVEVTARDENVREYVRKWIEKISMQPETALHDTDLDSRESIVEKVVQCTTGVFLLAVRHIDALKQCEDLHLLDETVTNLSSDLGQTIKDAIRRIQAQKKSREELGMRTLFWVLTMMRPLSVNELRHALATIDSNGDLNERRMHKAINIVAATGGLITMEPKSGVLSMHKSIADCFNSKHKKIDMFGKDPDAESARICIKYLCFSRFDTLGWEFGQNPFLSYAASFWIWHVVESKDQGLISEVKESLRRKSQLRYAVQTLYNVLLFYLSNKDLSDDVRKSLKAARAVLTLILESDRRYDNSYAKLLCDGEPFTCALTCGLLDYCIQRDPMIVEKFKNSIHVELAFLAFLENPSLVSLSLGPVPRMLSGPPSQLSPERRMCSENREPAVPTISTACSGWKTQRRRRRRTLPDGRKMRKDADKEETEQNEEKKERGFLFSGRPEIPFGPLSAHSEWDSTWDSTSSAHSAWDSTPSAYSARDSTPSAYRAMDNTSVLQSAGGISRIRDIPHGIWDIASTPSSYGMVHRVDSISTSCAIHNERLDRMYRGSIRPQSSFCKERKDKEKKERDEKKKARRKKDEGKKEEGKKEEGKKEEGKKEEGKKEEGKKEEGKKEEGKKEEEKKDEGKKDEGKKEKNEGVKHEERRKSDEEEEEEQEAKANVAKEELRRKMETIFENLRRSRALQHDAIKSTKTPYVDYVGY